MDEQLAAAGAAGDSAVKHRDAAVQERDAMSGAVHQSEQRLRVRP